MELIYAGILFWFILFLPISLLLSFPCWVFGRQHVRWTFIDYSVCVLPHFIWMGCFAWGYAVLHSKRLGNWFAEGLGLSLCTPISPLLRLAMAQRGTKKEYIAALLGLILVTVIGLFLFACVDPTGEK